MAKGEKALTKFSFFGGGTAKFEDAAECFNDAGKQFVMGKAYGEGASAYRRAADCHLKAKSEFDAAELCGKAGEAKNALAEYANLDYSFVGSEHMLCEQLTASVAASSEEGVATAAAEYDKIKRLDPWMTKLLAIKGT
ncbi:hypothetical protein JL720_16669 [Aureococcus anophagefferens]|nr:hypothetical protein JL720_16669 [Aureococcus anophagefferens]